MAYQALETQEIMRRAFNPSTNEISTNANVDVGDIEIGADIGGQIAGDYVYSNSFGDFTATANSGTKTITITGLPFTLESKHVINGDIKQVTSAGVGTDLPLTTVTVSGGVITLSDMSANFASGDTVIVSLLGPNKGYDKDLDVKKGIEQNPLWSRYTDPEQIVTASDIGASDGVYVDQGSEIDIRGYTKIGVFVKFTVNDSTTNTIKVLSKHTSAGSEEFVQETSGDYIKTLGDSNINIFYEFVTNGLIPYIQIQSAAADVDTGGGTIGTLEIYVVKGWQ